MPQPGTVHPGHAIAGRCLALQGFPKVQAECAVQATQGASIEAALLWIESHQNFDLLSSVRGMQAATSQP